MDGRETGTEAGRHEKSNNLTPMEGVMRLLSHKTQRMVRKLEAFFILLVVSVAASGLAFAQQPAQKSGGSAANSASMPKSPAMKRVVESSAPGGPQKLPLRRVVLYKSGIGYFEHDGHVRGNEDVEI